MLGLREGNFTSPSCLGVSLEVVWKQLPRAAGRKEVLDSEHPVGHMSSDSRL